MDKIMMRGQTASGQSTARPGKDILCKEHLQINLSKINSIEVLTNYEINDFDQKLAFFNFVNIVFFHFEQIWF